MVLQARNISKSFPGVKALDGVHLSVERGSVHAIVGVNGAGKSTLMRIFIGLTEPDDGEILLDGIPVRIRNPHDAAKKGIAMVHQELMPFPDLTVAENIFMGHEPLSWIPGWVDRRRMHRQAGRLLDELGLSLSPRQKMRALRLSEMQVVEIAKSLTYQARVIIMDEPTSALSRYEVERLFEIIRDLRRRGMAVIYVSHRLEETLQIADRVTILRDGRHVVTCDRAELDEDKIIRAMVGGEFRAFGPAAQRRCGDVLLSVERLSRPPRFQDVSFQVRRGEVLGVTGLMGAGKTELLSAISGLTPPDSGRVAVHGRSVTLRNPAQAIRHGIAMVTEDRKTYGLVLGMSLKHNVTLSALRRYCRGPMIDRHRENAAADHSIRLLRIQASNRDQRVDQLSGGNQQKVVFAQSLLTEPDILILDEPTRGIDVAAKAQIYEIIARLAAEGKAIILASSELPEVLTLSDRILILREGRVVAERRPAETSQEDLLRLAMPR